MTDRKALTRPQIIVILQRQAEGPILCGCGCGVALDPVKERVVDEHVIPRKLAQAGAEGERDAIENRAFYRWPCALEKTRADLARIAKAAAQGGETGQTARRDRRGGSSIKSGAKLQSGGFGGGPSKKTLRMAARQQEVTDLDERDGGYGAAASGGMNT